jgi:predicted nuclease with TOPRIM domain
MKNRIENIKDLRREIKRLESLKKEQGNILKNDVAEIKESLKPINLINSLIDSFFHKTPNANDTLKDSFAGGLAFVLSNLLSKLFTNVEHKVEPIVLNLIEKARGFFKKRNDNEE